MAVTDLDRLASSPGPMARHPHSGARYHEGADIIAHLNRSLGPAGWSWTTGEHGYDELADQVWVVGTLTARLTILDQAGDELVIGTTHTERGWQTANRKKSDSTFVDLGNDYKAADTDALKRAARLLGVGLDAWMKATPASPVPAHQPAPPRRSEPTPQPLTTVDLSPSARFELESKYVGLLEQARELDFRASWTSTAVRSFSDTQLVKYSELLANYIARKSSIAV